jgi:hypothetical protein
MSFLLRPGVPLTRTSPEERASQAWRAAADLVWTRWDVLNEATPARRPVAFAAYVAALDAEDSAAAALVELKRGQTA